MRPTTWRPLLALLADGQWQRGDTLGQALGLSRAGIWQRVECLRELNVPVEAGPSGYRIVNGAYLPGFERLLETDLKVSIVDETTSTNDDLLRQRDYDALVALWQSAGRGRRGRTWVGAPGRTWMASVAAEVDTQGSGWSGLSLAMGVLVAEYLDTLGISVQLKWPNDLYLGRGKLGGILIELTGDPLGRVRVVAGLGLNLAPTLNSRELNSASLADVSVHWDDDRARALLETLHRGLLEYPRHGLVHYLERYRCRCLLTSQWVRADGPSQVAGRCLGVDSEGQLLLETVNGLERIGVGDVSVRWN